MLRMVSYSRRPQSGHIVCYLNRTYHVLTTPPVCGFDRAYPTCYKRLFCAGRAGSESYFSCRLFRIDPGAKSDAAKLSTPTGLAVEACSEFRKQLIEARMGVHNNRKIGKTPV